MSQLKGSKHLHIPLAEIEKATKNYEVCIGKGGYGMVYKGELNISGKPTTVAIKRLNEQYGQGSKEFLTEIQLLSGLKHRNLIHLVGYCDEGKEKIIVYEYAERGSLDTYLRRNNTYTTDKLTWLTRLKICVDAARGLDYLHNHVGKHQSIIHRDIKSANILIDENWFAKVSDLGLSKLSLAGLNRSEVVSHPCGTRAYCEPEYASTYTLKTDCDVYSFGMVLFEVLCGRLCTIEDDDGVLLSGEWAKECYEKKRLDEIVDPSLKGEMKLDSMNKFAAVAYRCLDDDRGDRPPMGLVVKELEESLKLQITQTSSSKSYSKGESQSSSSKAHSKMESTISSQISQTSSSKSYSKRESQSPSSKAHSKMESSFITKLHKICYSILMTRLEKVEMIFQQFDLNTDNGLNKEELEQLLFATDSDLQSCSQEQINSGIDEVFHLYDKFIDAKIGLTLDGLIQIYDDGDGDLDKDYELILELQDLKPHNDHKVHPFTPLDSGIDDVFHVYDKFIAGLFNEGDGYMDSDYKVKGFKVKSDENREHLSYLDRYEKVRRIFHQYDLNADGGLNRNELASLIVATNPNVGYGEHEIRTALDDFLDLYANYNDGEKGLTFDGLLRSFDQGDLDLDLAFHALRFELNPKLHDQVSFEPRNRNQVGVHYLWVLALFLAAWMILLYLLGFDHVQWEKKYSIYLRPELHLCSSEMCKKFFNALSIMEVIGGLADLAAHFF
ncbi:hypothetical protein SSX86_018589 [Deinandra increscens subsp. villosa]|uniref:Uncharacterized protein n=1 Tax=Deinandra increscens subsp. villosa TaxID=3103831 RepID=A0AAP0GSA1_9ASTR